MLTQARLKELFDYDEDGWLIRKQCKNGKRPGKTIKHLYRHVTVDGKNQLLHRMIFLWHHGFLPEFLDHVDCDTLNNRIENLRPCSRQQNRANQRPLKNNTTGFKGIYVVPAGKHRQKTTRYAAAVAGKHIGCFETPEQAAAAYDAAAIELYGEFARLNFPKEKT